MANEANDAVMCSFRLTLDELAGIDTCAKEVGLSRSQYLRSRCLTPDIDPLLRYRIRLESHRRNKFENEILDEIVYDYFARKQWPDADEA